MVGLPGTGLGGIFYVGLAFWMILRAAMGASVLRRQANWHTVRLVASLSVLIILALAGQAYILRMLFAEETDIYGLVPHLGSIQLAVLFSLFALIHLARCMVIAVSRRRYSQEQSSMNH